MKVEAAPKRSRRGKRPCATVPGGWADLTGAGTALPCYLLAPGAPAVPLVAETPRRSVRALYPHGGRCRFLCYICDNTFFVIYCPTKVQGDCTDLFSGSRGQGVHPKLSPPDWQGASARSLQAWYHPSSAAGAAQLATTRRGLGTVLGLWLCVWAWALCTPGSTHHATVRGTSAQRLPSWSGPVGGVRFILNVPPAAWPRRTCQGLPFVAITILSCSL